MAYPKDYRYTEEHEWVRPTGKTALIGVTDFAQSQLGDIVFVEMPTVGDTFARGKPFGTLESVKAVSELYIPVGGKVVAVNEDLNQDPEEINSDAHAAWIIEIEVTDPKELDGLMTADAYEAYISQEK